MYTFFSMCILFLYVANQAKQNKILNQKHIKFIIAANRDEFYFRPSKPAQFWNSDPDILAGQDAESGGTWLGINRKTGRLAALTNIMGGTVHNANNPKVSRGALITDYLSSGSTIDGLSYSMKLHADPDISERFNKFNLLTIDLSPSQVTVENNSCLKRSDIDIARDDKMPSPSVNYFSNFSTAPPICLNSASESGVDQREQNFYGISNSVWRNPFQKVINGCLTFESILKTHKTNSLDLKDTFNVKRDLLHFLRNNQKHFPDHQIDRLANEQVKPFTRDMSSIFVCIPPIQYGTRTHTIIFVDSEDHVDFHEWTMTEPFNTEAKHHTWTESNFKFQLFSS